MGLIKSYAKEGTVGLDTGFFSGDFWGFEGAGRALA